MNLAATKNPRRRQEELGQFLTATPVADFMASMFGPLSRTVRLLDAGAGAGSLTAAVVSRFCSNNEGVRAIDATLYELDPGILDALAATMRECQHRCSESGICFTFTIHPADFIQEMSLRLAGDLFGTLPPAFDLAIANPPYRKISTGSAERRALRSIGVETSNLYTGFIALIQRLLVPGGQLVGITPRSFCNGPYFRPFREDFLQHLELRRLHVFESREAAFRNDSVLQENIIFHAVKGRDQPDEVKAERVGFENHLNYFHAGGHGLERTLAIGLYAFLNSTVVDQYYRRFSGHTQVNATDLRNLTYPDRDTLQAMGREMKTLDLPQDGIDHLVTRHLHAHR